jgi:hypothetical protein
VTNPTPTTRDAGLSVVVPSVNGFDDLRGCLDALMREASHTSLEVLVPERCGETLRHSVRRDYPSVRLIPVAPDTTIPMMRARAFRAATGVAVAVIEDHIIVPPGWAQRLLDEVARGVAVIGGSVENAATDTLLDQAAFLCEYSQCLRPLPEGPVDWLTGNNVAYRRDVLEQYRDVTDEGRWENYLHDRLRERGIALICRPDICVGHRKHYTFTEYLSQRYLYARSYAGARVSGGPLARRIVYALASVALPPLLFARIAARVIAKTKDRWLLLRCTPLILVFVTAWGWGELVGYTCGAGNSLQRVR